MFKPKIHRNSGGFGLLDVLITILVLSIALLSLGGLHAKIIRSSAIAKNRSIAANLTQEKIDDLKTFQQLAAGGNGIFGFAEIANSGGGSEKADGTLRIPAGSVMVSNVTYNRSWTVTDYYYCSEGASPSTTNCTPNKDFPDFRLIAMTVSWTDTDGNQSLTIQSSIDNLDPSTSGQGAASGGRQGPTVPYTPGSLPDVVPVKLDVSATTKKEATKPIPDTYKQEQNTITAFDEITYSTTNTTKIRDSFYTVNCVCQMSATTGTAYKPARFVYQEDGTTKWVVDPPVTKVVGVASGNGQQKVCDICCRDHHDAAVPTVPSSTSTEASPFDSVYDPFRPTSDYHASGSFSGDHKHYSVQNDGSLSLVTNTGEDYNESCRMVLVDGQLRVAQDWRLGTVNMIPDRYFTDASTGSTNLSHYSDYVKEYVKAFVKAINVNNPTVDPSPTSSGLTSAITAAAIPDKGEIKKDTTEQFSLRGIYVDYIDRSLLKVILCQIDHTDTTFGTCANTTDGDFLLYTPFHEVNLTKLAHWSLGAIGPVTSSTTISNSIGSVTDDAIPGSNQINGVLVAVPYNRGGLTIPSNVNSGSTGLNAIIGRSNTALTSAAVDRDNTDVSRAYIDPQEKSDYDNALKNDRICINVVTSVTAFPGSLSCTLP